MTDRTRKRVALRQRLTLLKGLGRDEEAEEVHDRLAALDEPEPETVDDVVAALEDHPTAAAFDAAKAKEEERDNPRKTVLAYIEQHYPEPPDEED
ncbi:MAG: hypothetical protein GEU73_07620 [Chloroflexi bacterium]|nr:hypothetical protein [Chloroflexota bacterium]